MNALRQALSHMNESSAESAKNPTNGTEEDTSEATEHIGGGKLHGVHIAVHGDGSHGVHAHMSDGTSKSSKHESHEEALAKAGEHLKAHVGHEK